MQHSRLVEQGEVDVHADDADEVQRHVDLVAPLDEEGLREPQRGACCGKRQDRW